ncbi:DoxX family protein [Rhodohalobacter sp. SW132]|uniref:DoxX family protein n=1 Tax=Rhodohalobacter sp. SW132 TaxID=2293433 RepID=UPI000E229536|nr:DoxX family protein [Rhodohalobacter sp. SW132]REL24023.1 DoxX family protein [Rhodohalobacter sp. SW132]
MTSNHQLSKSRLWSARIMGGIVILFMLMDSIFKFIQPEEVVQGSLELGYAEHHIAIIGVLGLISIILYAVPRTSILGAVLLTGYWGGAIATHLRLDNPLFSHILFPVFLGILAWGALWLRNEQLQHLFPIINRSER